VIHIDIEKQPPSLNDIALARLANVDQYVAVKRVSDRLALKCRITTAIVNPVIVAVWYLVFRSEWKQVDHLWFYPFVSLVLSLIIAFQAVEIKSRRDSSDRAGHIWLFTVFWSCVLPGIQPSLASIAGLFVAPAVCAYIVRLKWRKLDEVSEEARKLTELQLDKRSMSVIEIGEWSNEDQKVKDYFSAVFKELSVIVWEYEAVRSWVASGRERRLAVKALNIDAVFGGKNTVPPQTA
jgi:hypothetical protein